MAPLFHGLALAPTTVTIDQANHSVTGRYVGMFARRAVLPPGWLKRGQFDSCVFIADVLRALPK